MSLDDDTAALVDAIISGRTSDVSAAFGRFTSRETSGRALQLTSAFLHEKRHFLDFISTNYGAFRVRQFIEIYGNLPTLLSAGRQMERLFLPIEVYLDPVRRRVLGVDLPPSEVLQIAGNLSKKREMIEKDRRPFSSRFGSFEIGGEAQLEALAYSAQSRFVMHFGGFKAHDAFSDFVYDRTQFQEKYSAFVTMGVAAGLIPVRHLEELKGRSDEITHRAHLDLALLECAIFGALQADYVGSQERAGSDHIATSYPAERFAAIATHLAQEHKSLCENIHGLDWMECWEVVDKACELLFGLRIHRQIELDIEHHEQHLMLLRNTNDNTVIEFTEDYIGLRRAALEKLKSAPIQIASTEYFALSCGRDVAPTIVIASSVGELGDPPSQHTKLMAYDTTHEVEDERPWRKWWWAAASNYVHSQASEKLLKIPRQTNVYSIIDSYAPTSKLILNGRRIRTLVGPELLFAEQRAITATGVKFGYYPGFEFPEDEIPEDVLRFIRLDDELICDYSNKKIPHGEATVLTPWALRRYPDLARFTIQHLGDTDLAYHTFVKDWTHWVVSQEVMVQLRELMVRRRRYGSLDGEWVSDDSGKVPDISKVRIDRRRLPANRGQLKFLARHLSRFFSPNQGD